MNQVVLSLMRQFDETSEFEPLLIESDWKYARPAEVADPEFRCIRYRFRTPWEKGRELRSLLAFVCTLPWHASVWGRLVREERIQVINAHFPELDALLFSILKWFGLYKGKLILSLHGSDIRSAYSGGSFRRYMWRVLLNSADYIVSCSDGLGREVLPIAPNAARSQVTIHNGIDGDAFLREAAPLDLPFERAGKRIIVQIGQFARRKGHDLLVDAFAQVAAKYPDTVLVLVGGPGPEYENIKEKVRETRLEDRIFLLQSLEHAKVVTLMQSSELVVLASRSGPPGTPGEGFPMVTLEAAAVGKPVVSTLSCGATEILENGKNALLVEPENVGELARAISEMLDNPRIAQALASELKQKVQTSFTWKSSFKKYLRLASGPESEC